MIKSKSELQLVIVHKQKSYFPCVGLTLMQWQRVGQIQNELAIMLTPPPPYDPELQGLLVVGLEVKQASRQAVREQGGWWFPR